MDWESVIEKPLTMRIVGWQEETVWLQRSPEDFKQLDAELQQNLRAYKDDIRTGSVYAIRRKSNTKFMRGRVEGIRLSRTRKGNEYIVGLIDQKDKEEIVFSEDFYHLPSSLQSTPPFVIKTTLRNFIKPLAKFGDESKTYKKGDAMVGLQEFCRFGRVDYFHVVLHRLEAEGNFDPEFEADIASSSECLEKFLLSNRPNFDEDNDDDGQNEARDKVKHWLQSNCIKDNDMEETLATNVATPNNVSIDQDFVDHEISFVHMSENPGSMIECFIEHIESPALFYIHLYDPKYKGGEIIQTLRSEMNAYFRGPPNSNAMTIFQPEMGQYVAVYEDDNNDWYRGQIVNEVTKESVTVKVYLIDYGATITASKFCLRNLPKRFAKLPKFALPCSLRGVKPHDGATFSPEAIKMFNEIKLEQSTSPFQFKFQTLEIPLSIDLYIDDSKTVNHLLVEANLAKLLYPSSTWDPMASDFQAAVLPLANDEGGDFDKDDEGQRVCRFYRFDGHCNRGQNCQFRHVQTGSTFDAPHDESVMTVAHHEVDLPEVGEFLCVNVTVVRHPSVFYINILDPLDKTKSELVKLNQDLTAFYQINQGVKLNPSPFSPGEVVAAKYSDERWYRARIVEILDDYEFDDNNDFSFAAIEKVRVIFVDYGKCETLDLGDVREIRPQFLELPFQGVECSLANVVPAETDHGHWSDEARKALLQLTSTPELRAKVTENTGARLELELFIKDGGGSKWDSVGKHLIDMNLARPVQVMQNRDENGNFCPRDITVFPG